MTTGTGDTHPAQEPLLALAGRMRGTPLHKHTDPLVQGILPRAATQVSPCVWGMRGACCSGGSVCPPEAKGTTGPGRKWLRGFPGPRGGSTWWDEWHGPGSAQPAGGSSWHSH